MGTLVESLMINPGLVPGIGEMATAALARIVSQRPFRLMTAYTIHLTLVVKDHLRPRPRTVAALALPIIVASRQHLAMTAQALLLVIRVVKSHLRPGIDIVAAQTRPLIVRQRRLRQVAGETGSHARVVHRYDRPIFHIIVAQRAGARVMQLRRLPPVARLTLRHLRMVIS